MKKILDCYPSFDVLYNKHHNEKEDPNCTITNYYDTIDAHYLVKDILQGIRLNVFAIEEVLNNLGEKDKAKNLHTIYKEFVDEKEEYADHRKVLKTLKDYNEYINKLTKFRIHITALREYLDVSHDFTSHF